MFGVTSQPVSFLDLYEADTGLLRGESPLGFQKLYPNDFLPVSLSPDPILQQTFQPTPGDPRLPEASISLFNNSDEKIKILDCPNPATVDRHSTSKKNDESTRLRRTQQDKTPLSREETLRQKRKLSNRESARKARLRKVEERNTLLYEIESLKKANQQLVQENKQLLQKIALSQPPESRIHMPSSSFSNNPIGDVTLSAMQEFFPPQSNKESTGLLEQLDQLTTKQAKALFEIQVRHGEITALQRILLAEVQLQQLGN